MLRLVCTSIPHLSFRWNWKQTVGSRWTCLGVRAPRTLDRKIKSAPKCTVWLKFYAERPRGTPPLGTLNAIEVIWLPMSHSGISVVAELLVRLTELGEVHEV